MQADRQRPNDESTAELGSLLPLQVTPTPFSLFLPSPGHLPNAEC